MLAALLMLPACAAWSTENITGKAIAVDGDSLEIGKHRIRLWGVDAPEFSQTCKRDAKPWKCGAAAKLALRKRVAQRTVSCEVVDTDKHGRSVSRCAIAGASLNEWLVRQGWATDYARYSHGAYANAQAEAKRLRRGIWSGEFEQPERYRHPRR